MEKVLSVEHYYALIAENKKRLGILKTNCTLARASIQRLVLLERFYYQEIETGIFFFSDEEAYYQAYYYLQDGVSFTLERKEKPVLLQNIHREESNSPFLVFLQQELVKNGFVLQDTLRHAVLEETDALMHSLEKAAKSAERIFRKKGFVYQRVEEKQLEELKSFMQGIDQIPYYQFPYYTDREYIEESEAGRLSCIVDDAGRILAARHLITAGRKVYGWVGIEEEYKALYGFTPFFLYTQMLYLREHNMLMCSWVKTTNQPSIQYHNRVGAVWTGQVEDEWLLEKREGLR